MYCVRDEQHVIMNCNSNVLFHSYILQLIFTSNKNAIKIYVLCLLCVCECVNDDYVWTRLDGDACHRLACVY